VHRLYRGAPAKPLRESARVAAPNYNLPVPSGARFAFSQFELDATRRRLTAAGEPLAISDRQLDILALLVARAGQIVAKDDLLQAGWKDVAVGDNSLEQAISSLRRVLGARSDGAGYIETVPRRGYRFAVAVTPIAARESDETLDALLAPHRAFVEGRALLESLAADRVRRARIVFEEALRSAPDYASAHIGLANACAMQFEMTRADPAPDEAALAVARRHAREACRLDPQSAEAWATLGFVLDRGGEQLDASAAAKRAVTLEPDNWRHHFRLAYVSWGEERLRAAHQTLALLPHFPLAHWLAATVYVARQVFDEAERELDGGLASHGGEPAAGARFSPVALHWLRGLIRLSRGDDAGAFDDFERELASEHAGQLYARECAANTWYAIGALHLRRGRREEAGAAFTRAIVRVAAHPMANVALAAAGATDHASPVRSETIVNGRSVPAVEAAMAQAAQLVLAGDHGAAGRVIADALASAPRGNAAWTVPIEPLLQVAANPAAWTLALARLRNRAA
jgi:DNA-binding winged helix-turn-helix (wHTH) protein